MEPATARAPTPKATLARVAFGVGAAVAYAPLLGLGDAEVPDVGETVFVAGAVPPLLAISVAGFLLWRRRDALRERPATRAPLPALALAGLGAAFLLWGRFTGVEHLLLPSAAMVGLAVVAWQRGARALRVGLLPAGVALLGAAIPKPLEDEILWALQNATAAGAAFLLESAGREIHRAGVVLVGSEHTFHVIDGCAGLGGIAILTLVAFIVRDLLPGRGWRSWRVVAIAPFLGALLNVARVAYVAASPDPEALAGFEGDHTPQGLAVIVIGTLVLYALGARWRGAASREDAPPSREPSRSPAHWGAPAAFVGVLAVLGAALAERGDPERAWPKQEIGYPAEKKAWTSVPGPRRPFFTGPLPGGFHRTYYLRNVADQPYRAVGVLVGFEIGPRDRSSRLFSSKLHLPGPDWSLVERRRTRVVVLDREVEMAVAARGDERAVVYAWRTRHRGFWHESLRSWLALDALEPEGGRPRGAVRLVAYAPHDGVLALDRAKQRLDRYAKDFSRELGAI